MSPRPAPSSVTFPPSGDHASDPVSAAQRLAHDGVQQAAPALERLARLGYAGKGVLYFTIGLLALLRAANRPGGAMTDQRGAMRSIDQLPFGPVLIVLLGAGLAGYAMWQVIRAVLDPERQGTGTHALVKRAGYLLSAFSYLALALATTSRGPVRPTGTQTRDWTAQLLHLPGGRLLVGVVGLAVIGVAVNELRTALTSSFMRDIDLSEAGQQRRLMVQRVGQLGVTARAVVFALIGWFFLQAAWRAAPDRTGGLKDALDTLASGPLGQGLLALVAAGLIAFGLYCGVLARYRRIRVVAPD